MSVVDTVVRSGLYMPGSQESHQRLPECRLKLEALSMVIVDGTPKCAIQLLMKAVMLLTGMVSGQQVNQLTQVKM